MKNTISQNQNHQACLVSRGIARRILCLPTYPGLAESEVSNIVGMIINE